MLCGRELVAGTVAPSAGQVIGWGAQPHAGGWFSVMGRTNNVYSVRGPGEVENIAGIAQETIIKNRREISRATHKSDRP